MMRSSFYVGLFFASALVAPVHVTAQQGGTSGAEASDRPVTMPTTPTSLPFRLRDNLIVVDTIINGQPHTGVLDSGAGALILDATFARTIALRQGDGAVDAAGAGTQTQQLRPIVVPDLTFGPIRFERLSGYAGDLSQLTASAGFPINFLIGAPAFKHGAVTVDYARRRVTFGPSGSAGTCAAPIPIAIANDAPVVEAEMRPTADAEPVRLKLLVDLGTRHNALTIGGPFVRSEAGKALARSGVRQKVGHGTGGGVEGAIVDVAEFRLGGIRTTGLRTALTSDVPAFEAGMIDGTIGVPLWEGAVVTFDYPARSLCITQRG